MSKIKRYEQIDQPHAVYEWGMIEDKKGEWVRYEDIKHLIERPDNSDSTKSITTVDEIEKLKEGK